MTPRLFGLAFLVQMTALGVFILQQLGGQPAPPPHLADDVQDIIFLGPNRPLLVRFHLELDGKPFRPAYRAAWDAHVKTLFAFLDRDGNGRLSAKETERMPAPQMFLAAGIAGFGNSGINVAFNFSVVDADNDGSVSLPELAEYYREYSNAPFAIQSAVRSTPPQINGQLFSRLDRNGDGFIDADEAKAAAAVIRALDLDEDELLTAQELAPPAAPNRNLAPPAPAGPAREPIQPDFVALDPNDDRKIVLPLMAKYGQPQIGGGERTIKAARINLDPAEMVQLDTDKDNQLTADELVHFPELTPHLELTARFVRGKNGTASWELHNPNPLKAVKTAYDSLQVLADHTQLELIQNDRTPERLPAGRDAYLNHLQEMDANNDGLLSKTEAQPSPFFSKLFNLLDRDENDVVTPKETLAYLTALQEGQFLALASRLHMLISQPGVGLFDLLDRNQDGRLSARELRDLPTLLGSMDENKDGKLGRDEVTRTFRLALGINQASFNRFGGNLVSMPPQLPNLSAVDLLRGGPMWFRKMDRNRDGDVSPREFVGTKAVFDRIDTDRDGLISADEANQVTK